MRNNGDGTFTDVTAKGSRPDADRSPLQRRLRGSTTTATAASICSSRATWTPIGLPAGESSDCRWKGVPVMRPRGLPTGFVQLFHNNGDGTFTDVSRASRSRPPPSRIR